MSKKIFVALALFFVLIVLVFLLTPVGEGRSKDMATTRFEAYCIENRFNCSGFEGPIYQRTNEEGSRVYTFENLIKNSGEVIVFEVRVPKSEIGKVTLGTKGNMVEINQILTIRDRPQ